MGGYRPGMELVVQKYGGTSVAGPERIRHVAERVVAAAGAGRRVCVVVSAMGKTTDELLSLARSVSDTPDPRELDMLVSVGERISCALAAMAIKDLGHAAVNQSPQPATNFREAVLALSNARASSSIV